MMVTGVYPGDSPKVSKLLMSNTQSTGASQSLSRQLEVQRAEGETRQRPQLLHITHRLLLAWQKCHD